MFKIKKKKKPTSYDFFNLADVIVATLTEKGIECYVWCKATTGSAYIRFNDSRMCSIRLGDHEGKSEYKYKYNVRSDVKKSYAKKENDIWRLYYPVHDLQKLYTDIEERHKRSKEWGPAKFKYGTPKHKMSL